MNDTSNKALKMLNKKLTVLKEDAVTRSRDNLKQYIEECIALLKLIERNK
jgi:hypothetical protein